MSKIDFKKVTIKNFLSVGNTPITIDFKRGINVITGINKDNDNSKNGVGKSSILESMYYCLYGQTMRELTKNDIVNNINRKGCAVRLEFTVYSGKSVDEYILTRCIGPTKLTLLKNGKDVSKSSIAKTTDYIISIIGTPDLIQNSTIMTLNGMVPFMHQKKVERRKFCEGLFNLNVFSDMLLEIRKRHNSLQNEIVIEQNKFEDAKKNLDFYVNEKTKESNKNADRKKVLLERKTNNIEELKTLNSKIIDVKDTAITKLKTKIKKLNTLKDAEIDEITKILQDIAVKEKQINDNKGRLKNIKNLTDTCDLCQQSVTHEHKDQKNKEIKSVIKTDVDHIKTLMEEKTKHSKQKIKLQSEIDKCREMIVQKNAQIEENRRINDRVSQLNIWLKQLDLDLEELEKDRIDFDDMIKDAKARMDNINAELDTLHKQDSIYVSMKYIVSEEGVKSFIVKRMLKLMNGRLRTYLLKLEAPCRFKFNEYFEEEILNERGNPCSYNNFSSGEQKRIDLALLFTFMDIKKLQGNVFINVLFFDEILDSSLDDKGIHKFLEILKERVDKNSEFVYIITHRSAAIKSATADVIFLEKENGFTKLGKYVQ